MAKRWTESVYVIPPFLGAYRPHFHPASHVCPSHGWCTLSWLCKTCIWIKHWERSSKGRSIPGAQDQKAFDSIHCLQIQAQWIHVEIFLVHQCLTSRMYASKEVVCNAPREMQFLLELWTHSWVWGRGGDRHRNEVMKGGDGREETQKWNDEGLEWVGEGICTVCEH